MRPRLGCESNLQPDTANPTGKQKRFGKHGWPYIGGGQLLPGCILAAGWS